jgi:hypothetical protein
MYMRKTIIAYILTCIEEITDDVELGMEMMSLQDVIFLEIEKKPDNLLSVLFFYTVLCEDGYYDEEQLGLDTRQIYNEIKYFFDEYTEST